jgi:hypothetical protein
MSRLTFVATVARLVPWAKDWRRVVSITVIVALSVSLLFPPPAHAQFGGLLGGIQNIINIINGAIRSALNVIRTVARSIDVLHQQVVWPIRLIDQARSTIALLIDQFRALLNSIYAAPVTSATLPLPAGLESIVRNHQTNDFANLTQSFYQTFGAMPAANEADPMARNMIDIDDGLALDTLKTLKATDQAGDLILESGNQIEDEGTVTAPGSAPFLTAAAMAANIQSQAMMQKMLAATLRQEAARIAHGNAVRKRQAILSARIRQGVSDALRRP